MENYRLYIDSDDFKLYKEIKSKTFLKDYVKENRQIFMMAVLIGKYVLKEKLPLENKKDYIRYDSLQNLEEMDLLTSLAIVEKEDVNLLNDIRETFDIMQEYANAGIKVLYKWTKNETEFQNKITEVLINFYNINSSLINQNRDENK